MPGPFTITSPTNTVILDKNRSGEATFSVTNASGLPVRGRAQLSPIQVQPPQVVSTAGWLTLSGSAERDFPIAGIEQFVVKIAVPAKAPVGSYSFRLDMAGAIPDEEYSEGPTVAFDVIKEEKPKRKIPWWIFAIVGGVLAIAAIVVMVILLTRKVEVPDVHGRTVPDAQATLVAGKLEVGESSSVTDSTTCQECVVATTPEALTKVRKGSEVDLVLSSGPDMVSMPSLRGLSWEDAQTALEAAGLAVGSLEIVADAEVAPGNVASTTPGAGESVAKGSTVTVTLSSGPGQVVVPNLVGSLWDDAQATLEEEGLVGSPEMVTDAAVPSGHVVATTPEAGKSVDLGSPVIVMVSLGPGQVPVPDVREQTVANAQALLEDAGLTVGSQEQAYSSTIPAGRVLSTDPVNGTPVDVGTTVALVVSLGPEQVRIPATILSYNCKDAALRLLEEGFEIRVVDTGGSVLAEYKPSRTIIEIVKGLPLKEDLSIRTLCKWCAYSVKSTKPERGDYADKGSRVTVVCEKSR